LEDLDEVMRAIRRGSEGALQDLMTLFRYPLESLAFQILSDRAAAEDAVQEAILNIWTHRDQYDPSRRAWPWIASIVRNACHEQWRRRGGRRNGKRLCEVPLEYAGYVHCPELAPDALFEERELTGAVKEHIAELPATWREVVHLFFFESKTEQQIAELLGISIGTVKSRKHRALRRIREQIDNA